jgi:hypothetical protein
MKIHAAVAGMLCFVALGAGACVMPSTYDAVVADLNATNAELDGAKAQSKMLTEQVNELQQLKVDLAQQMEAIASTLQQEKQQMQAERVASQARLNKLTLAISQLMAQQNKLLYALRRANEERPELQLMVEGYKSKLSEADEPRASLSPPLAAAAGEPAETALAPPAQVAAQADSAPQPTVTTPAAPADPAAANPKPQPATNQTTEPVEDDWLSILKGWVIAFWQSIFL